MATEPLTGRPPDEVLEEFAETHGRLIRSWSLNAFNMLEIRLHDWARSRKRVEHGYGAAAQQRLTKTAMPRELESVNGSDGSHHWASRYASLYQRVALELEQLAIRRPRPHLCPLCKRPFIPIRPGQRTCANNTWDTHTRRLVARCTPPQDTQTYDTAASQIHATQRKTHWARMNRARQTYGPDHPRTHKAIQAWNAWQAANPPPRPPGRPATRTAPVEASFLPPKPS